MLSATASFTEPKTVIDSDAVTGSSTSSTPGLRVPGLNTSILHRELIKHQNTMILVLLSYDGDGLYQISFISTDWHIRCIRLAGRIFGDYQRRIWPFLFQWLQEASNVVRFSVQSCYCNNKNILFHILQHYHFSLTKNIFLIFKQATLIILPEFFRYIKKSSASGV